MWCGGSADWSKVFLFLVEREGKKRGGGGPDYAYTRRGDISDS